MPDHKRSEILSSLGVIAAIVLGLYLSSRSSYLLFHGLIEICTIAIAFTLFILTWNTRRYLTNNYLRLLGIGYVFIALIDLLHTLAYKGMNVFPGYGANLPTQLWIAARYLQAVTLVAAPLLLGRRVDNRIVFGGYVAAVSVLAAMVFSGNFPDCFIEGKGLTFFKISSEYVITVLLLVSIYLLYRKRKHFSDRVFVLAVSSIACTALSEISFTAYVSVYGFANLAGHFAKLAAFYLIYRAILVTGLKEPFELIFLDLKMAREHLEEQVGKRTAELKTANEELKEEIVERQQAEESLHRLNRELQAISNCNQTLMRAEDEQALLNDVCRIICIDAGYRMAWVGYAENDGGRTVRPVAWAGVEEGYLANADITWDDRPRGRGPTGTAIRTGKTDCIQDFAKDPKAAPWRESALQRGYRSSVSLPLMDESKKTFGALTIYSTEPEAFSPEEIRLLEELAGDLAFGITVLRSRIERKRSEEALRESEARHRQLVDMSRDMITIYLYEQKTVVFVNEAGVKMTGAKSPDQLIGRSVLEFVPPGRRELAQERIRTTLERAVKSPLYEQKLLRLDGTELDIEVWGAPFKYQGEAAVQLVARDITERKRAEKELLKLNEELEQRVKERTAELEKKNQELVKMNKLFVGRELRMKELKERINQLEK